MRSRFHSFRNALALAVFIALVGLVASADDRQPGPATNVVVKAGLSGESIIAAARRIDWSSAGAGTIPARSGTPCYTDTGGLDTAAEINTQLAACAGAAVPVVLLQAGTYNLTAAIVIESSNVTLRGAGSAATFLVFGSGVSDGCGGKNAVVCIKPINHMFPDPSWSDPYGGAFGNQANWTAGYTKGATSITLDSITNLDVGDTLVLTQQGDNDEADPGDNLFMVDDIPYVCCSTSASTAVGQSQIVKVTSITGAGPYTVGITPGLYMPNWASAENPQANWKTAAFLTGVGLEDLSIERVSPPAWNIAFFNAEYSWMKHVRSVRPFISHVILFVSHHITIRDSYFFDSANQEYGIDPDGVSDFLVENNIFQCTEVPLMVERHNSGGVFAYNYTINNHFNSTFGCDVPGGFMQHSAHDHGTGNNYILYEGNDGNGSVRENYFALAHLMTEFRNRWTGYEAVGVGHTAPILVHGKTRFHNYVGNVLGTNQYHTSYLIQAATTTTSSPADDSGADTTILSIGLGGNNFNGNTDCGGCTNGLHPFNDTNTMNSIMFWGNYDLVNDVARFEASEVPSGHANFPNPVPATQVLPASFYLSAKPSWWGTMPWPPIGPDVTGGDVTGTGLSVNAGLNGHVWRIPARKCFEDVMGGSFNDTTARTFNPAACGY